MRGPIRSGRRTLVFMAFLAIASNAPASPVSSDYTVTSWTKRDGLPAGSVWSICQDNNGYLWLGTSSGLFRFDGMRFVSWDALSGPALPSDAVTAMTTSRDGSFWLGFTGVGIARVRNNAVTVYREPESLGLVRRLIEDNRGVVWASGRAGVFRFVDGRWRHQGGDAGLPDRPSQIHLDQTGVLWVATGSAMFRQIGDGRFEPTKMSPHLVAVAQERFASAPTGADKDIRVLFDRSLEDRDGNVWVATFGRGLWRIKAAPGANSVEHMTVQAGLSSDAIGTLYEDHDRNIWIGTLSGLDQLTPRKVKAVRNIGQGIAVEATADGSTWIATDRGLVRWKESRLDTYTNLQGLSNWNVRSITRDARGRLWIVLSDGIVRFENGRFSRLPVPAGTRFGRISAITVDSQDRLWICDYFLGILQWHDGELARFDDMPGANGQTALTILADHDDRIWIGFAGGRLGVVERDGRFLAHDVKERAGTVGSISSITEGEGSSGGGQRVLWLGTAGIIRLIGDEFVAVTSRNGWPAAKVLTIVDDGHGSVWAATNIGLIRIEKDEFDRVASSPAHKIRYKLYDDTDGLEGAPSVSSRGAVRAADGDLWFTTDAGAMVVNPAVLQTPPTLPKARIEEIRAGGRRFESPAAGFTIPPGASRIEIDYTALTFVSPRSVRFEYRLDGFDTEWQDAGPRRQAIYTNLPPGAYQFRVLARDKEGSMSTAVAAFAIEPPLYRRAWFAAFVSAALIGLLIIAWRIRIRQVRARFALVLAERARISREVHDTLIQSLVAVAVQLGAVVTQIAPPDTSGIRHQLSSIRKQVEEQIREARESIWNLRSPTLERLGLVSALRQAGEHIARQGSLQFSLVVSGRPRPCSTAVEAQLLRIGREALTNVWRHARASEVRLELAYEADRLLLRVTDNGIGFDPDAANVEPSAHSGLVGMTERAEETGGELTIISGQGRGTEVVATFPTAATEAA